MAEPQFVLAARASRLRRSSRIKSFAIISPRRTKKASAQPMPATQPFGSPA